MGTEEYQRLQRRLDERIESLDPWPLRYDATYAAYQLDLIGFTYCDHQPGDGTSYKISIVRPPEVGQWQRWLQVNHMPPDHPAYQRHPEFNTQHRYFVATSFGPLYGWNGWEVTWDYVLEKWVMGNRTSATNQWTARMIARFLTELAERIKRREEEADEQAPADR